MNRRELFQAVAGVAAASGVTLTASTVDADAKPVLAIIEYGGRMSNEAVKRILTQWEHALDGTPFAGLKAVVFSDGFRLTVLDAQGRPLNRRLEDEPSDA